MRIIFIAKVISSHLQRPPASLEYAHKPSGLFYDRLTAHVYREDSDTQQELSAADQRPLHAGERLLGIEQRGYVVEYYAVRL